MNRSRRGRALSSNRHLTRCSFNRHPRTLPVVSRALVGAHSPLLGRLGVAAVAFWRLRQVFLGPRWFASNGVCESRHTLGQYFAHSQQIMDPGAPVSHCSQQTCPCVQGLPTALLVACCYKCMHQLFSIAPDFGSFMSSSPFLNLSNTKKSKTFVFTNTKLHATRRTVSCPTAVSVNPKKYLSFTNNVR